jgi:hypothetical protein
MSNEKNCEKQFGRKPKGSNMKSISSWVITVPNGKLKGDPRWEERRDYGKDRKRGKEQS